MTALADASTLFSPKRPRSNRPFPYAFLPWDMRASGVPADGADPDLVRKAVEGGVCAKRLSASLRDSPAALQNLGLACGGVLTNAAALLFAESCRPLVTCRAYDSPYRDVLVDGCDCAGPLDGACGKACAFSLQNAHVAFGSGRAGDSVYAGLVSSVLREAVVNALIHRDYLYFAPVRIDVLPGCIEISNPGMLPSGAWSAASSLESDALRRIRARPRAFSAQRLARPTPVPIWRRRREGGGHGAHRRRVRPVRIGGALAQRRWAGYAQHPRSCAIAARTRCATSSIDARRLFENSMLESTCAPMKAISSIFAFCTAGVRDEVASSTTAAL